MVPIDKPVRKATFAGQPSDLPSNLAELVNRADQLSTERGSRIGVHHSPGLVTGTLLFVLLLAALLGLFVGLRLVSASSAITMVGLSPTLAHRANTQIAYDTDPCSRTMDKDPLPERG